MNQDIIFNQIGDASILEYRDSKIPSPSDNEVCIKVDAIGLNRAEIMFREGNYLEQPRFPSRLGYEASGTIESFGKDVTGFKLGDKVSTIPAFSMGIHGVYGKYVKVPAHAAAHYPENLSAIQAAAIWMQYLTAYGALIDIGKLKAKQTILITAASSSVGIASIQLAKQIGATVIACSRRHDKKSSLLAAGADFHIATETQSLVKEVMNITDGKGAQLIFDAIAGPIIQDLAEAAAQSAQIIEYGALDSRETPFPLYTALAKGLSIRGYTLFEITQNPERLAWAKEYVYRRLKSGEIKPLVDKIFAFEQIQLAHEYMERNQQVGKIIVKVDH
ncbi:MAG: NADPH:quinone reductase-like Zn-dependent oxidoreductase [Flavobacteriales bacterium]|jgi:NADPH:quinone reductase-like Zn-dependent oxidoreductase